MSWMHQSGLACLAFAAVIGAGCDNSSPPLNCPAAHPTFDLTIAAADGVLPPDTQVRVWYGGSTVETFDLSNPMMGMSVFCHAVSGDAGAPGDEGEAGDAGAASD